MKSTALRFGADTPRWLTMFAAGAFAGLAAAGYNAGMLTPYFIGCGAGLAHLLWQIHTVDQNDRADCMAKFVSNKDFGWLVFVGIIASIWWAHLS